MTAKRVAQPDLSHLVKASERENLRLETAAEQAVGTATYDELVQACEELRTEKEEAERLEAEAKQHKDRYEELRKHVIPDLMRRLNLVSGNKGQFTFPGGKIHLETKVYANCPEPLREKFFAWLRANGHQDLVKETVNAQTLSAFVRERRESGEKDPPGVVTHEETVAKLTKR